MSEVKVIGLTGGVGSGKTFIAEYAKENFGVAIILADEVGHIALEQGRETYYNVVKAFGNEILREDKSIDRDRLGKIVFEDGKRLQELNQIVHPFIEDWIQTEVQRQKAEGKVKYLMIEAAILLESNLVHLCDEIWFVKTEKSLRKARLEESRGYSAKKIEHIMKAQLSTEEMMQKADTILVNLPNLKEIQEQLEVLLV